MKFYYIDSFLRYVYVSTGSHKCNSRSHRERKRIQVTDYITGCPLLDMHLVWWYQLNSGNFSWSSSAFKSNFIRIIEYILIYYLKLMLLVCAMNKYYDIKRLILLILLWLTKGIWIRVSINMDLSIYIENIAGLCWGRA